MNGATEGKMPLIGDKFPEITVRTTHGQLALPGDYGGRWFVLFSHPGDFTPVCTTEFVAFQKRYNDFRRLGVELIGLSVDQVFAHLKWVEWIKCNLGVAVKFPVIADPLGTVASRLGMIHPSKGPNTVRSVFVVDDKGIIRAIIYYPMEVGRNIREIVRLVHALQTTDNYKVATPADWPNNDLIGEGVILPPPGTEQAAKEKLCAAKQGEICCFDWWFCYKELGMAGDFETGAGRGQRGTGCKKVP